MNDSVREELRSFARRRAFAGGYHLSPPWAELWQKYSKQFPVERFPVTNRIWFEILRRCSALEAAPDSRVSMSSEAGRMVRFAELRTIEALRQLILPLSAQERRSILEACIGKVPHGKATAILKVITWSLRGRPADKRGLALRALEMKMIEPKLTWHQIGTQLGYKPGGYERSIAEVLPAEVRAVKRILRSYGINLSS